MVSFPLSFHHHETFPTEHHFETKTVITDYTGTCTNFLFSKFTKNNMKENVSNGHPFTTDTFR